MKRTKAKKWVKVNCTLCSYKFDVPEQDIIDDRRLFCPNCKKQIFELPKELEKTKQKRT